MTGNVSSLEPCDIQDGGFKGLTAVGPPHTLRRRIRNGKETGKLLGSLPTTPSQSNAELHDRLADSSTSVTSSGCSSGDEGSGLEAHVAEGISGADEACGGLSAPIAELAGNEKPVDFVTLSGDTLLHRFCCAIPAMLLFSSLALVLSTPMVASMDSFYFVTAFLTFYTVWWSCSMCVYMTLGAGRIRRDCARDWQRDLEELQAKLRSQRQEPRVDPDAPLHLVILPNYEENEAMLQHSLENLGRSSMARQSVRVVLAMEEREGTDGKQKAERLMARTGHLFSDILATYHPVGIPGEEAGKSSNTQWAFRQVTQRYAAELSRRDPSQVYLTVGDADTLWHPEFFSALTYQGLTMSAPERSWTIWQPPILLVRNLLSVPAPTRVSSYGTMIFELGGLTYHDRWEHMCYSAYSLTLALATHKRVRGWDADVIAEDHHMFLKCYFASIEDAREQASAGELTRPKTKLSPIYLPAVSYLAESTEGWWPSVQARFTQARRHSQGVAELGYLCLRWILLSTAAGGSGIAGRTHLKIFGLFWKIYVVHIFNSVQALALTVAFFLVLLPQIALWALTGGLLETLQAALANGVARALDGSSLFEIVKGSVYPLVGPIPVLSIVLTITICVVVCDALEGRYSIAAGKAPTGGAVATVVDKQGQWPLTSEGRLSLRSKLRLLSFMQGDLLVWGNFAIVMLGTVPVSMAAWSLLRKGTKFDYLVAAKPE